MALDDLARRYNPYVRGWINYYQPLLQVGTGLDNYAGLTCLLDSLGAQQVQAPAPAAEGCTGVVRAGCPLRSESLRPLEISACQRPDIGSRMKREFQVRF